MLYLLFFVLGFLMDRYGIAILDLVLRNLENMQTLKATEMQYEIDEIVNQTQIDNARARCELATYEKEIYSMGISDEQIGAIGFQTGGFSQECCDEDDCEDDCKKS